MAFQRQLTLDTSRGSDRFKVLWIAFGFIPQAGMTRTAEVLRRESSIGRKLRQISETLEINEEGQPTRKDRNLKSGEQKLILEQTEIELLRQRIEAYPYWNPLAEESPADVYDWLSSGSEMSD